MTLFAYGFRTFFPLAGLSAALTVVATVLALTGKIALPDPIRWHAHEMLFGFAPALMAGFFLTAVPNWTKRPRVQGPKLMAVAALWLAGRAALLFGASWPPMLVAGIDVSFLVVLGALIGWPIFGTSSRRNMAFPLLVWMLAAANLVEHLQWAGMLEPNGTPRRTAILTLVVLIITFGGRILPLFTRGALRRVRAAAGDQSPDPVRDRGPLDQATLVVSAALIPLSIFVDGPAMGVAFAFAAVLNLGRMYRWATLDTLHDPLLLILHVGYLWIPVAFTLSALSQIGVVPPTAALHALTAGVIGTFALGMMSRVMRGHTGRPLVAPRIMSAAYVLLTLAALIRVFGPILWPAGLVSIWHAAGDLWGLAFLILVVVDLPKAWAPRPDGKAG